MNPGTAILPHDILDTPRNGTALPPECLAHPQQAQPTHGHHAPPTTTPNKGAVWLTSEFTGVSESQDDYVPPYSIALIYTGLGKQDEALEWLQKAFVEHSH